MHTLERSSELNVFNKSVFFIQKFIQSGVDKFVLVFADKNRADKIMRRFLSFLQNSFHYVCERNAKS